MKRESLTMKAGEGRREQRKHGRRSINHAWYKYGCDDKGRLSQSGAAGRLWNRNGS
jgi:hypothetical protein